MSNALAIRMTAIPVQTVAFGSITSSFVAFGSGMPAPIRILKISNTTDEDIYISFDGTTIQDAIPALSGMVIDLTANKTSSEGAYIAQGTVVYLKYVSAPSLGNVYLSAYYAVAN
jgi:hypothetical protein